MTPKISVILPVFNGEKYLSEAVNSILRQKFSDFELLIFDDGSTDRTFSIMKNFRTLDRRVKIFFSSQNRGLIKTLNELIKLSNGSFIARMDADDISHPNRLFNQHEFLVKNELEICGTAFQTIDRKGSVIKRYKVPLSHSEIVLSALFKVPFPHGSMMAKATIFNQLCYDESSFEAVEDYFLWVKMIINNIKFGNLDDQLYSLRVHKSSFSGSKRKEMSIQKKQVKYFLINNFKHELGQIYTSYCADTEKRDTALCAASAITLGKYISPTILLKSLFCPVKTIKLLK